MPSKLDIQVREEGDVTVLTLVGQMTLDDGDLAFRKAVHDLLDQKRTKLVADIGGSFGEYNTLVPAQPRHSVPEQSGCPDQSDQ